MIPHIQIRIEGLDALRKKFAGTKANIPKAAARGVMAAGIALASDIKANYLSGQFVKVRTGIGRRSVTSRMVGPLTAWVGPGEEGRYLQWVNSGERPHLIRGNPLAFVPAAGAIMNSAFARGAGLRKTLAANVVFARFVHHPGLPGVHFMEVATNAFGERFRQFMNFEISKEIA